MGRRPGIARVSNYQAHAAAKKVTDSEPPSCSKPPLPVGKAV
ncbi:UNVERIFIED_ORG: hypothetical protein ABIC62_004185 [Burkholderia sp. 1595]|uniref:Uncharacterized protein n=1 Tax=Paraburkholderia terricola TaxID=169427 RepID=A0ABU1LW58_9BURK|nr:hypothetical protein [Paraburkholderia terricola]